MDEEFADTEYDGSAGLGADWATPGSPAQPSAPAPTAPPMLPAANQAPPRGTYPLPYYPPAAMYPPQPAAVGTVEESHNLGISLLVPGIGGFLGLAYGGAFGAIAGLAFGGAAVNAYRAVRSGADATDEGNKEAIVSGTYAAIGVAFASWVLWHRSKSAAAKNEEQEEPDKPEEP
jgi:hypothetical protein